jgi:hypothetical protein
VLDFTRNERPTTRQSETIRAAELALAKDPRSGGQPVILVPQTRRLGLLGGTMQSARALDAFITSFERVLGKEVIFLRSGTDRVLPFDGLVLPERPNTIFLDADGDANVAALLGHEWAHTLQVTNRPMAMGMFLRYSGQHSQMTKV